MPHKQSSFDAVGHNNTEVDQKKLGNENIVLRTSLQNLVQEKIDKSQRLVNQKLLALAHQLDDQRASALNLHKAKKSQNVQLRSVKNSVITDLSCIRDQIHSLKSEDNLKPENTKSNSHSEFSSACAVRTISSR